MFMTKNALIESLDAIFHSHQQSVRVSNDNNKKFREIDHEIMNEIVCSLKVHSTNKSQARQWITRAYM